MNDTNFFISDETGNIVEKAISLEKAKELYKSNSTNTYPPVFYRNTMRCKEWQVGIGECVGRLYSIKSVVDFGCGLGYYLEGFKNSGVPTIKGFEVSYDNAKQYISENIIDNISQGDVMTEINCGTFELSMSIEVAEHILPEKSDIFVKNLANSSSKYIMLTAAPPGQGGVCHINEQPMEYWKDKLRNNGFEFSQEDTSKIRAEVNKLPYRGKYFSLIKKQITFFRRNI